MPQNPPSKSKPVNLSWITGGWMEEASFLSSISLQTEKLNCMKRPISEWLCLICKWIFYLHGTKSHQETCFHCAASQNEKSFPFSSAGAGRGLCQAASRCSWGRRVLCGGAGLRSYSRDPSKERSWRCEPRLHRPWYFLDSLFSIQISISFHRCGR